MGKYILTTFEAYSKSKKKIWDSLLRRKKRDFKSVKIEPEIQLENPDMTIPSPYEAG
jgi:hypothetical protein